MNSSLSQFGQRADDYGGDWPNKNRRIVSFEEGDNADGSSNNGIQGSRRKRQTTTQKVQEHGWRAHILNRLMYCYKYYLKKKNVP